MRKAILMVLLLTGVLLSACKKSDTGLSASWMSLLDQNLSHWDKFIGVPHTSITTLPGYPKGDGMNGQPLGLNNDPLNVYKIETIDGVPALHISGEIYGGLTTKEMYGNYHFTTQFKWGDKKYEPRLTAKRDNGILYHAQGPHAYMWNVWMKSQEMQVQEGDMGDYFALGPIADIAAVDTLADGEQAWMYVPSKALQPFGDGGVSGRCRRQANYEKPHGEWNTLELICLGGKSLHIVNGHVVMILENSRTKDGSEKALEKGYIQIQSEGAEAYYRNMQIRGITEIPEAYR